MTASRGAAHWATHLECSRSGETAPLDGPAFLSPAGAPWMVRYALDEERGRALRRALAGRPWSLWRYRELLPVSDFEARVDLGEGGTPLIRLRPPGGGRARVWLKQEAGNPTGSFKARGLSLAVNRARELGSGGVELASAGNAGLALAAYAAAAGMPCRVALPEDSPPSLAATCRDFGAEVLEAPGTLVEARGALAEEARGYWDVSTLREPYRVEGKKTLGLELAEQLGWRLPDWIVYPTGGGTGVLGMAKAFDELRRLGLVAAGAGPRFVAVQMAGCAPLVEAFAAGAERAAPWGRPRTRVWGLRVPRSLGDFLLLDILRRGGGRALAVEEEALEPARQRLARQLGIQAGPEGAAAWLAYERLERDGVFSDGERVVVFQTGHPANYA